MRAIVLLFALLAFGSGAVAQVEAQTPTCSGEQQCGARWIDAQQAIQNLTRMRLRMVTESRLETFAATGAGRMTGVVTKYPVGDGVFELRAEIHCPRHMECSDLERRGVLLFNAMLGGAPAATAGGPAAGTPQGNGSQVPAAAAAPSGNDSYQAQQLAKTESCSAQPVASLSAKGAGFETYSVPCSNGDALAIRCEFGNCRVLR